MAWGLREEFETEELTSQAYLSEGLGILGSDKERGLPH